MKKQGFAAMDPEQKRAIARKGGLAVSQNRQHMAEIGRKGGQVTGVKKGRRKNIDLAWKNSIIGPMKDEQCG